MLCPIFPGGLSPGSAQAELAGILSMDMPRTETTYGTTKLNQRLTTAVDRLSLPGFEFSESCHGILSGCRKDTVGMQCTSHLAGLGNRGRDQPRPVTQPTANAESLASAVPHHP